MVREILVDMAKGLFGITFGGPGAEKWELAKQFVTGQLLGGEGSQALTEPYRQHPIIAKAVGTIARDAASVDWEMHRVTGGGKVSDKPDLKHPVLSVWKNPNPWMNGRQLWIGSYISKYIFGEYIWYYPNLQITRPTPGSSPRIEAILDSATKFEGQTNIMLLDPRKVVIKVVGEKLKYYLKTPHGTEEPLDETKITHSKRWNPYNPIRGLSIMESLIHELVGDYAASQWNARFFNEQNGIPSGLLIPGGVMGVGLDQDQRKDYGRMWNQRHSSGKRSVATLPAGWTFQDLGVSQRDMDFKGLREYSREIILGTIGMPPFLAGVLEKANYANAREQKEVYWQHTIESFLEDEAEVINNDFFPKIGIDNYVVQPDWDKVKALLENLVEKTEVADKWFKLGISKKVINERLEMGWNEDDIPDYEVSYLTMQQVPVEELLTLQTMSATPAPPPEPPALPAGEEDEEEVNSEDKKGLVAHGREFSRRLRWKAITQSTRSLESEFRSKIRAHFERLRIETLRNVQSSVKGLVVNKTGEEDLFLFDAEQADAALTKVTKPVYEKTIKKGGTGVLAEISGSLSFQVKDPRVIALTLRLQQKIKGINDTVERQLRETLREGLLDRDNVDALAKRVDKVFQVGQRRSRVIAKTEIGMAHNGGRFLGMMQADIERIEWLSTRDPEVRDSHAEEDGVKIILGERFPTTGLHHPQEAGGPPEEIIQCRCVAVPVVEEDEDA